MTTISNSYREVFGSYAPPSAKKRVPRNKKVKRPQAVINPIFQECANLTDDPLWKELFTCAAGGRFPQGFTYRDGNLFHKRRNRLHRVAVESDPATALVQCMQFFRTKGGIVSDQERVDERLRTQGSLQPELSWKSMRKKNLRNVLIGAYIDDISAVYRLTIKERRCLREVLNLGFYARIFDKDKVCILDNRIHSISNLYWDPQQRKFTVVVGTISKRPSASRSTKKASGRDKYPSTCYLARWKKLINNIAAKRTSEPDEDLPSLEIEEPLTDALDDAYSDREETTEITEDTTEYGEAGSDPVEGVSAARCIPTTDIEETTSDRIVNSV